MLHNMLKKLSFHLSVEDRARFQRSIVGMTLLKNWILFFIIVEALVLPTVNTSPNTNYKPVSLLESPDQLKQDTNKNGGENVFNSVDSTQRSYDARPSWRQSLPPTSSPSKMKIFYQHVKKHSLNKRAASPSKLKYIGLGKRGLYLGDMGDDNNNAFSPMYGSELNGNPRYDGAVFLNRPNIRSALLKWTGLGRRKKFMDHVESPYLLDEDDDGQSNELKFQRLAAKNTYNGAGGNRATNRGALLWSGLGKRFQSMNQFVRPDYFHEDN